jgi:hypothetical protein
MLRRVKMVLPLFFAFLLTLLPFLLLEFTQAQRVIVQQERELYLWEQQANNYLQLFINLWSPEFQLRRRLDVFRRRDAAKTFRSRNLQQAFASGISKRLSGMWKPDYLYAGSFNKATGKFKMFQGRPFSNLNKLVFSTIMQGLSAKTSPSIFLKHCAVGSSTAADISGKIACSCGITWKKATCASFIWSFMRMAEFPMKNQ